ncbi:hypothetical protein Efla_006533 [Eimeria flavescens]
MKRRSFFKHTEEGSQALFRRPHGGPSLPVSPLRLPGGPPPALSHQRLGPPGAPIVKNTKPGLPPPWGPHRFGNRPHSIPQRRGPPREAPGAPHVRPQGSPLVQGALLRVTVAEISRCAAAWLLRQQQQQQQQQQQTAHPSLRRSKGPHPHQPAEELSVWGPWRCSEICVEGLAVSLTRTRLRGPPAAAATAAAAAAPTGAAAAAAGYVDIVDLDDGTGVISCRWVWKRPPPPSGGGPHKRGPSSGAPQEWADEPPRAEIGSFYRAQGRLLLRRCSGCCCSVRALLLLSRPLTADPDPNAEALAFAGHSAQRYAFSSWQQLLLPQQTQQQQQQQQQE